jgi:hypothetical protein
LDSPRLRIPFNRHVTFVLRECSIQLENNIHIGFTFVVSTLALLPGCLPLPSAACWGAGGRCRRYSRYHYLFHFGRRIPIGAAGGDNGNLCTLRPAGIHTLAITAAVMAGFNPNALWDPGF